MKARRPLALLLALTLLALTGCGASGSRDLTQDVTPRKLNFTQETPKDAGEAAARLGLGLLSLAEGENPLLSPLSILYALAMTENGAAGETLAEMETLLGRPVEELNAALGAYLAGRSGDIQGTLHLANGIWLREREDFTVEPDFLQTNADCYQAGIYAAPFTDATLRDINAFVREHTDGMIDGILSEFPPDTVMVLVNALAFQAEWRDKYEGYQVQDWDFTRADGSVTPSADNEGESHLVYIGSGDNDPETENATGFLKPYQGGRYAFLALLPNENSSLPELLASLTPSQLRDLAANPQNCEVRTGLPKFQLSYDADLTDLLPQLGMVQAFDPENADFSRLGTVEGENLYLGQVLHRAFIAVGEKGTRAGAATSVAVGATSAMPVEEPKTVLLDRPFLYAIWDTEANLPVFLGTFTDPAAAQ